MPRNIRDGRIFVNLGKRTKSSAECPVATIRVQQTVVLSKVTKNPLWLGSKKVPKYYNLAADVAPGSWADFTQRRELIEL